MWPKLRYKHTTQFILNGALSRIRILVLSSGIHKRFQMVRVLQHEHEFGVKREFNGCVCACVFVSVWVCLRYTERIKWWWKTIESQVQTKTRYIYLVALGFVCVSALCYRAINRFLHTHIRINDGSITISCCKRCVFCTHYATIKCCTKFPVQPVRANECV